MRKKNTAFILILSFLMAGMSTGCNSNVNKNDYSEVEAVRGDIVGGLSKEGNISVGTVYENIELFQAASEEESSEQTTELEQTENSSILEIEEVYAVPGLAVNQGVPVIKLTDESVQAYKEMLDAEQKKAERDVSLAEMDREVKSLDAEYTYKKSIENGTNAKAKRDLAVKTLEDNLKALQNEVTAAQQRLSALQSNNGSTAEIEAARSNLSSLESQLQIAQNEKEAKTIEADQAYEQAQLEYNYAEEVRESALKGLDDAVLAAQNYLTTVNYAVEQFNNMSDGEIKASYNGTVVEVNCKAGEKLKANTNLITYADSSQITMTVGVPQSKILSLHVGDAATLKLDVYDGEVISGEIANLEPSASKDVNENGYEVTVRMTDNEKKVYADMTGRIVFTEKVVEDVIIVPVEAITREKTVSYVQTYDANGSMTKIEVKTGFSDGDNVEITSGLEEGAKVLVKNVEEKGEETK